MTIVEVEWLDAWADTSTVTLKKAINHKPELTRTVGYLMAENDDGITIATDRYPKTPKQGKIINFIPWGIISNYWVIEVDGD